MDKILIKRLEIYAFHGVFEEEKRIGQKFYLTIELDVDTMEATYTDDLKKSVHYGEVCENVTKFFAGNTWDLIETAASKTAEFLLKQYSLVKKVVIDLEKPSAPVPYHIETISVHVERKRHQVFLSIGSNLGERQEYLSLACRLLNAQPDIWIKKQSPLYETAPYGYVNQPAFLNGCLEIETLESPDVLLETLNRIEYELGRKRDIHWGPRTIDIDILLYDNEIIDTPTLHIPHIDMQNRMFVLQPLADIAAYKRHPYLNMTVVQMLEKLKKAEEGI